MRLGAAGFARLRGGFTAWMAAAGNRSRGGGQPVWPTSYVLDAPAIKALL